MTIFDIMASKRGKIIVSIILAFGLACMLRIACDGANMIVIKGPPISSVQDKIFSFDDKCYSYKTVSTSCKNMENNEID